MKPSLFLLLLTVIVGPLWASETVVIPTHQCHYWGSNAATIVMHKQERIPLPTVIQGFTETVKARGLSTTTYEFLAVIELIKEVYKNENNPEKAYEKYYKECIDRNGQVYPRKVGKSI